MINSALIESQLLNLAIASSDSHFFAKLGINADWFTQHRPVYEAYVNHCKKYGETPSLQTLVSETDSGFTFEDVEESADTLVRKLRELRAKTDKQRALQKIATEWATLDADTVTQRIKEAMDDVDQRYGLSAQTQSNWTIDAEQRVERYKARQSQQQTLINSGFDSWNREVGPFKRGDYVVVFGKSGRGKTHISRAFITLPAVRQGFRVLDYILEQTRDEAEAMLDSLESAYYGAFEFNGLPSGFSERSIIRGDFDEDKEREYIEFVTQMDRRKLGYGDYIVKTMEDEDMLVCNLDKIESDIELYKPDIVLIDQISLMSYERVRETKNGGGAEATSRRFRRMCVRKGIVGVMLAQAQVESNKESEEERQLNPPDESQLKTSKALLEDAVIVAAVDSVKGKAVINCRKGRMGGAGFELPLQFFPNYGVCREIQPQDMF